MGRKEMFYLFNDILINERKIVAEQTKKSYNMELDIEKMFKQGEYFKSLIMTSNMIEAFLRRFYHYYSISKKGANLLVEEVDANNHISLSKIIEWASGNKITGRKYTPLPLRIIEDKEVEILTHLKNIRNDLAHVYYLNFDENINKDYAEEIIRATLPILHNLIGKYLALRSK